MSVPLHDRSLVDLPDDLQDEFEVYVNSTLQEYGSDYHVDGRTIVFSRPLIPEARMTAWQWIRVVLGIAGTYTKHDRIDITYERDGHKLVATGLQPREEDEAGRSA